MLPPRHMLLIAILVGPLGGLCLPSQAAISKSQAGQKAQSLYGGKVLSVELVESKDGKTTYRVKLLLDDGRVKTTTVSG